MVGCCCPGVGIGGGPEFPSLRKTKAPGLHVLGTREFPREIVLEDAGVGGICSWSSVLWLPVILLTGFGVAATWSFLLFQEERGVFSYLSQPSSQIKGGSVSIG